MDKYDIKAKPTMHNGRLYRSRLEAKWAVFFDFLRWEYEYEPEPLDNWSPDFLLPVAFGGMYVEIKPIDLWDDALMNKIKPYAKAHRCGLFSEEIVCADTVFYLGKYFNRNHDKEALLLKDLGIPYNGAWDKRNVGGLWVEASNKIMYKRPNI